MATFDNAHCKEVMGHYVTGIVIITTMTPDGPAGFTCQTFGSLSIDSALVFFAATTTSPSWQRVRARGVVGVNILRDDQEVLARGFAVSGVDKFEGVAWTPAPNGSPFLDGCLAYLEGTIREVTNHGDHDIAVAELDFAATEPGGPLAYYRGGYRALAP
ncbi:MAG TPA: flavin reductase family protein [Acidimicrobiales bacterium]|nr:flavin reductase family protein [Acidimicrobiales bacterium]